LHIVNAIHHHLCVVRRFGSALHEQNMLFLELWT